VLLAVALAVAGLVLRLVPLPIRQAHNAATGTIYAALYVMFGVTLGFSLLLVWQQYDAVQKSAESEQALRSEGLQQLDDLEEYRSLRLQEVREGLPPIMWVVLVLGGVLAVAALTVVITLIDLHDRRPRLSLQQRLAGGTGRVRACAARDRG
jgi:hypothetical protein